MGSEPARPLRVALLHDWLTTFGGAERVLIELHHLFPTAPIYTLVCDHRRLPKELKGAKIETSFIQRLPGATRNWSRYLPLFPLAVEQFDLRGYDLIISNSAITKGVLRSPGAVHLSYCYTPPRYIWDLYHTYLAETRLSPFARRVFVASAHYLRLWDRLASERVDYFVAISQTVRERIERIYRRKAPVVYPPTDTDFFTLPENRSQLGEGGYYLVVGRFVPYKKHRLVVEAMEELRVRDGKRRQVIMVGDGPLRRRVIQQAPREVEFIRRVSDEELRELYWGCRALIFPAEEDFGLAPVEAMACGRPVIALGRGGTAETVVDGVTGVHFAYQEARSLADAIQRFEYLDGKQSFDPEACRQRAESFSRKRFLSYLTAIIKRVCPGVVLPEEA